MVRNADGDFIMAFSIPVICNSNNEVEALATRYGAECGWQNGYTNFILELDSLITKDKLTNHNMSNTKLRDIFNDTIQIINQAGVVTTHYFREANQVADVITKNASSGRF